MHGADALVDTQEILAKSNDVHLVLRPDPRLTWSIWGTAIGGISSWVETYEFVDCDFEMEILGYSGRFGSGTLIHV